MNLEKIAEGPRSMLSHSRIFKDLESGNIVIVGREPTYGELNQISEVTGPNGGIQSHSFTIISADLIREAASKL